VKKNLPITDNEYKLADTDVIISATDLKGAVTSVNQTFKAVSGFSDDELLGKNHNVVRHPDMPPAAFDDLWTRIKDNQTWMGIVKNRCKNGDYYWVDAFVTPLLENGRIMGYESTRVKPDQQIVQRAEKVYQAIWANKFKLPRFKLNCANKVSLVFSAMQLMVMAGLHFITDLPAIWAVLIWLFSSAIGSAVIHYFYKPLKAVTDKARKFMNNPITQYVYTGRYDEAGQLDLAMEMLNAMNRTILKRLEQVSGTLEGHAQNAADLVKDTQNGVQRQQAEIEQVATAINEMTATVQEVARNTQNAAEAAESANQQASVGASKVNSALEVIQSLSGDVEKTESSIQELANNSVEIGTVLDVIKGVAEQTNLLALNAAIEAARAGEQGRGFAVVADEVRTLASRTQESTEEIQSMIEKIQNGTQDAVNKMADVRQRSMQGLENVESSATSIKEMRAAVETMNTMNTQIASAAEEQSVVSGTISENIENINQVSHSTDTVASEMSSTSLELADLASNIHSMINQFGEAISKP